jgi:DNA-directed RNA polymerase specialized sigma24 family protein
MKDWVERLQSRDATTMLAMYDRWSRPLAALVSKISGKPEEAEAIVLAVFKTFWERSQDPNFLRGSLFGILADMARFKALDAVNSRGFKNGTQEWAKFEVRDKFSDPNELRSWERLPFADRVRRAKAALEGLDEGERQLVEEALFEGMTTTRLAIRHNLPPALIREQLADAVRKLEAALEDVLS